MYSPELKVSYRVINLTILNVYSHHHLFIDCPSQLVYLPKSLFSTKLYHVPAIFLFYDTFTPHITEASFLR